MFLIDNPSYKLVAAKVTKLVNRIKIGEEYWSGITQAYYRSANEGILSRSIESLRLIKRLALCRNNNHLLKWTDF